MAVAAPLSRQEAVEAEITHLGELVILLSGELDVAKDAIRALGSRVKHLEASAAKVVTFDRIRARELEIVDETGRVRIQLECDKNGYARILMFTAQGKQASRSPSESHRVVHLCAFPDVKHGIIAIEGPDGHHIESRNYPPLPAEVSA
jgi:hypothetical protein